MRKRACGEYCPTNGFVIDPNAINEPASENAAPVAAQLVSQPLSVAPADQSLCNNRTKPNKPGRRLTASIQRCRPRCHLQAGPIETSVAFFHFSPDETGPKSALIFAEASEVSARQACPHQPDIAPALRLRAGTRAVRWIADSRRSFTMLRKSSFVGKSGFKWKNSKTDPCSAAPALPS
jgi:hypothetical protein